MRALVLALALAAWTVGCDGDGNVGEGEGEGEEGEGEEGEGEPPAELSVLLIGNSQLGLNPPDVAAALASMSRVAFDGGSVLNVDRVQNFGEGCSEFAARTGDDSPRARASSGDYDVVVLLPAVSESSADAACWDLFRADAEGAGSAFAMMATAHILSLYPEGFIALHDDIRAYSEENDALFIPVGDAWLRILGDDPSEAELSELYSSDAAHPGPEGDLVYVYALYAALTGRSAVGLPVDAVELRCDLATSCLTYEELDGCVDDTGAFECAAQNGAIFGPNGVGVAFVTPDEAAQYQAAVDAALQ